MTRWTSVRRLSLIGVLSVLGVSGAAAAAWQVHLIRSAERVDLLLPSAQRAEAMASLPAPVAAQVATPILPTSKHAPVPAQPIVADKYHDAEGHPWPMKSEKRRATLGPDSPDEALRWKQMFEKDEFGNIPADGLMNASKQMRAMRTRTLAGDAALMSAGFEPDPIAGIASNSWTWAGPGNIGGRTRAIAVHPTTTSTIFAGSVAGGIWKSTDGGSNWNVVDDFMANLAISSIVFQPGNPNVMFAGTGEGFSNADAIRGAGIFRSVDGGSTWNQLPNTANASFILVNELAFSPDGSILMAATSSGFFRSTNNGDTWTLATGGSTNAQDVKFLPGSNTAVVGGGRAHNAFFSTNGGATFQAATIPVQPGNGTGNNRVELAIAPSNGGIVYASVAAGGTASSPPAEIWKSTDSGATYSMISTNGGTSLLGAQGWYDNAIWVDPVNENNVIVGGVSLFRSIDGGVTWASIPTSGVAIHSDHHVIIQDPGYDGSTNKRVYFGNDGGLYKIESLTFTGTQAATRLNNNYGVTQFYGGDGLVSTGRLFGGTQDNGTPTFNGNPQNWVSLAGADGGMATADQVNNFLYGETQNLGVHRSNNGAASVSITACSNPSPLQDACASTPLTNFIAPLLLDPNNPDRLLAGGAQLWLSTNPRAATNTVAWTSIKPAVANNISAIAVAKSNSDLIWVGHSDGNVYLAEDGTSATPTWTQKDTNSPGLPNRAVSSINVDPTDVNTAYVSFGGFSTQNIWVTHDRGGTWTQAAGTGGGTLPAVPVRWVVPHPSISGWIYAATDVGIFTSENSGNTWQVPHDGPANVAVFQLFFLGNTLVAATHGRGMYTAVVSPPSVPPSITTHPASQTVGAGQRATLSVAALGSAPLNFQWFRGSSPSTASPVAGATSSVFTTPPLFDTTSYWVRVTNSFGTANSNTATVTTDVGTAIFSTTLKAPSCTGVGVSCDSGPALLLSRGAIAGGGEANQPNTINNSCGDGAGGTFHVDESIDRIKVSTLDGLPFAAGKTVRIDVTVWADAQGNFASDRLDIYGASDATNPTWNLIAGNLTPAAGGAQVFTVSSFVLPTGTLQAIRASFRFSGTASPCGTNSGFDDHDDLIFAVNPSVGTQLLQNGDFSAGLTGWKLFEIPDIVHNNGAGGNFRFHKAAPLTTPSGQAVIFQETGIPVGTDKAVTASFQLANLDTVRKRISVLVVDANYVDLSVCTFWLPASAAPAVYSMKTHPTRGWANAAIYFYAASTGLGDYQVDNVSMTIDGAGSTSRTECIDPTRPTPPGGVAGPNLITNGDFSGGLLAPWVPFANIQNQVTGGVFEFIWPGAAGQAAGGILQSVGQPMTANQIMTATFKLGNSSSVRKRVTILLHDLDFSDLSACSFYLAPGQPLSDYAMRTFATKAWTNASISIFGATTGPEQWTQIDNVTLNRTPAGPVLGTECFEPGSSPEPPPPVFERTMVRNSAAPRVSAPQSGSSSGRSSSGGGFRVVSETPDDPFSWIVEATAGGRSTISWAKPVDLTDVRGATLKFESSLSSIASPASVQVSLDGDTWQTLASLSNGSATMVVDLNDFVGRLIYVRFVFDAEPPPMGVEADVWRIGRVVIDVVR